ncbi:MAG: hypothetical protein WCL11_07530 [Verrucomicrobiota bacterium]
MIRAGELIQQRVSQLRGKARTLYYAVMLFQRECTSCGNTALEMERDAHCQCHVCGAEFDPTVQFQTCPDCDHPLVLKVYHYWCPQCRHPIRSIFCFDERVFNSAYFRGMMRESRNNKREHVEKLRQLLLTSRSPPFWPTEEPVLKDASGFANDLAPFVAALVEPLATERWERPYFDMEVYRKHLLDLVSGCVVDFEGVSALVSDARLDRVYRFITAIFLEHEGMLVLEQSHEGRIKLVGA